jgi:hypothetical protein
VNDRSDGYAGDQYELIGYDAHGQPVYRQLQQQSRQAPQQQDGSAVGHRSARQDHGSHDGYGMQAPYGAQGDPYGYDGPYDAGQQPAAPPQETCGTDPHGTAPYGTGQQPAVPSQDAYGTGRRQAMPSQGTRADRAGSTGAQPRPTGERGPGGRSDAASGDDYQPEQFAFVEDDPEDSEDVIDWLKFTESRTERREEARRRARSRVIALVVVLALALAGGVGYLWYAGRLPALPGSGGSTGDAGNSGPQNRDVIVVHLHNTKQGGTSTALLVDNTTTRQGATILLPNSLALTNDDGTATTLAKSVNDDGSTGTRDSIDTLLGTRIQGTWRLDTPYLENLVELVGDIDITTNTDVPDPAAKNKGGKGSNGTPEPLVKKGEDQTLSGAMAVAYATYRAPGEPESAQLNRFGQVMLGVLRKMSSDPHSATVTVQTLEQILDPSLTDQDLGAFLAKLSDLAKQGDYTTMVLPDQPDGTLSEQATDGVVKKLLGGTVKPPAKGAAVQVGVRNATGAKPATESARIALINGGYTFVDGTTAPVQMSSQVTYADDKMKQDAIEVAKTLGLPTSAVKKSTTSNTDVSVVLGENYDYKQQETS